MTCAVLHCAAFRPLWLHGQHPAAPQPLELCDAITAGITSCVVAQEDVGVALHAAFGLLDAARESCGSLGATDLAAKDLIGALLDADVPAQLLANLSLLDFEAQKDAMRGHPRIICMLIEGCGKPDLFLHCGHMFRACARYPELVGSLLEANAAARLMDFAQHQSFDISSDAFESLRELLMVQRETAAAYLASHSGEFFTRYSNLLLADGYITRRLALKLLGDLVEDGSFASALPGLLCSERCLKLHMNLLLETSAPVQLGAFRVLKAFVEYRDKPPRVRQILLKNRERLTRILEGLPVDKDERTSYAKDVCSVVRLLEELPAPQRDLTRFILEARMRDALAFLH